MNMKREEILSADLHSEILWTPQFPVSKEDWESIPQKASGLSPVNAATGCPTLNYQLERWNKLMIQIIDAKKVTTNSDAQCITIKCVKYNDSFIIAKECKYLQRS